MRSGPKDSRVRPNYAFKPTPLRYANHMAKKACHAVGSTARRGLTSNCLVRLRQSADGFASQLFPTSRIDDAKQLAHAGDQRDLGHLPAGSQLLIVVP